MSSLNRVILIGRLTRDVDKRATPSGLSYARFTLAVDRRGRKNNDGNNTDFIPVVAWDKLADICGQYLSKGKLVAIDGRLQTRTYEQDGVKRSAFDVVAEDMRMLSPRDGGSRSNDSYGGYDSAPAQDPYAGDGGLDAGDIPF